ncbi:hypothetical protein FB565_006161 [Actinoplanes lutulentus]|uniref:TIR domain-containing protein n=1 Tax=Actinoplanes lutulentus TaxID=1287878 RepID=A0A327ZA94_9ACTN|nr:P-loop NTPase fold protein [Actinoplanes lutulentus]MBB2946393.1 hypothetical protein [Actinoplanes lutulentus]RAK28669.1 TIR domain-containing protein [Actinoplanes lutulentus]
MGDAQNLVEVVYADDSRSSHSGYHLGGGLILTVPNAGDEVGHPVEVLSAATESLSGRIAWIAAGQMNAALIQLDSPLPRLGDTPVRWGILSEGTMAVECEVAGISSPQRALRRMIGTAIPLTGSQPGLLTIAIQPSDDSAQAGESPWQGFFGGPVWSGDYLIGVTSRAQITPEGERLAAVPVAAFAHNQAFLDLVTGATGRPPHLEILNVSAVQDQKDPITFDVFLSYANRDIPLASRMDSQLSRAGLNVYFAERLVEEGTNLDEELAEGVRQSKSLVVIVSAEFAPDSWVLREISMAQKASSAPSLIIPVRVGGAKLPPALMPYLGLDLAEPTDEAEFASVVARIVATLRGGSSGGDVPAPATVTATASVASASAQAFNPTVLTSAGTSDSVDQPTALDDAADIAGIGIWGFRDRPAQRDALRRDKVVEVVTAMLCEGGPADSDPERRGPTVVALEGAWGTGKTTLMDLIEQKLGKQRDAGQSESPQAPSRLRAWRADLALSSWPRWRQVWEKSMRRMPGGDTPLTARFEPWTYQTGEQVWAGLAATLLESAEMTIGWHDHARERYWFQRNSKRLDAQQLRQSLRRRVVSPLFKVGVFALIVPIVSQLARATDTDYTLGDWVFAGVNVALLVPTLLLAGALLHTAVRWFRPVATMLPTELFHKPVLSTALSPATTAKADPAMRDPYYRAHAGYLYLLQHDVFHVLGDIDHELIVFIDDLDRCGAKTTADVFEAINMFLTRHFPTTRFVIGLDAAAVVAHLDDTYSALANQKQIRTDADPTVGWSYLRKLIQLQIPVPGIPDDLVPEILAGLLTTKGEYDQARTILAQTRSSADDDSAVSTPSSVDVGLVVSVAEPASGQPAEGGTSATETIMPAVVRTLELDREVRALLVERLTAQPNLSVREAKRLLTTWQFYVHLVELLAPMTGAGSVQRARHLIILSEILVRWPASQRRLLSRVKGEHGLVLLARSTGSELDWGRAINGLGLTSAAHQKACSGVRSLLQTYDATAVAELAAQLT